MPSRSASPPTQERLALADFREMQDATPELVRERADIVDAATDVIERMLDDVVAVTPASTKGQDLIPQWEADYRTLHREPARVRRRSADDR